MDPRASAHTGSPTSSGLVIRCAALTGSACCDWKVLCRNVGRRLAPVREFVDRPSRQGRETCGSLAFVALSMRPSGLVDCDVPPTEPVLA